jgi:DNA-binding transcriptional MocR family regulator
MKLDMSRGKPNPLQLDLSSPMLKIKEHISAEGIDCRNYGPPEGLIEIRELFSQILGVETANVIIGGASSLNLMFDLLAQHVFEDWGNKVKFLCPSPGYDRHFAICDYFGIEAVRVPFTKYGPDMDIIENLVKKDASVKGVWCVPKYSNPTGITFSDETVARFARLKPAARDFRIFWDNAYVVHSIFNDEKLLNIFDAAENPDMIYEFASFSKISFGASGVCCVAASPENAARIKNRMKIQLINHDKLNQLRHALFFKDAEGVKMHMQKHAELLRPKFLATFNIFNSELKNIAEWSVPNGGYFISFYSQKKLAKKIVEACAGRGLVLTPAGAAFPYGFDPDDSHIRIAPSYPSLDELEPALDIFCDSVKKISRKRGS